MFSRDRVVKFQFPGTEGLGGPIKFHSPVTAVLGVADDGEPHVGAVDPELVGSAGNGMEGKFT